MRIGQYIAPCPSALTAREIRDEEDEEARLAYEDAEAAFWEDECAELDALAQELRVLSTYSPIRQVRNTCGHYDFEGVCTDDCIPF